MGAPHLSRPIALAGAAAVVLAAGVSARYLFAGRARATEKVAPAAASSGPHEPDLVLHVPHSPGAIVLDGDTDDPGWTSQPGPSRTHEFVLPSGAPARPFSEIRFVWGDGYLYLCLYAADEDIESRTTEADGPLWLDDAFRVVFGEGDKGDTQYAIEVSPRAVVTDSIRHGTGGKWDYTWSSGVHVSKEMDGTLNNPRDMDEEWVIEMAVPFEAVGLKGRPGESIGFSASRCDTPKNSPRVCGSWGQGAAHGRLVLD